MMHEEPLSVEAGAAVTADSIWEACINIKEQGRKARNSTMEDKGEAEGKEERQKEHCNLGVRRGAKKGNMVIRYTCMSSLLRHSRLLSFTTHLCQGFPLHPLYEAEPSPPPEHTHQS